MGWIATFQAFWASLAAERSPPLNEFVTNGASYNANTTKASPIPGEDENPAASVGSSDAPIPEEIKRRQIAIALRYVQMARSSSPASFGIEEPSGNEGTD